MTRLLAALIMLAGCDRQPTGSEHLKNLYGEDKTTRLESLLEKANTEVAELRSEKYCRVELVSEPAQRTVIKNNEGTFITTHETRYAVPCVICNHAISCAFSALEDVAKRSKAK